MNWHTRSGLCSSHQPQAALTKVLLSDLYIQWATRYSLFTGEHCVIIVPEALMKELAGLRFAFTKLLRNYEKQLRHSPEAQEEFVKFTTQLFHREISENRSFQLHFNTLVEQEVSLFNTYHLKQFCTIFPEDVR